MNREQTLYSIRFFFENRGCVFRSCACLLLLCSLGCDKDETEGVAPPAPVVRLAQPCAKASATPIEGLVGMTNGYCIDAAVDVRRYGIGAPSPLSSVCVELFNGECELYKSYGLEGVKTLQYVAADGSDAQVNVVVSRFRRSAGAFGFYTHRILGDGPPSHVTMESLEVEGRAAFGVGMSVLWRGKQVIEATYIREDATPQEIEEQSPDVLHPMMQVFSSKMTGATEPERSVRLLEIPELDHLGVRAYNDGLLHLVGTGPGIVGHFSTPPHPHRVLIAERRDEQGSKDLLRLFRRSGVSKKLKGRDIIRLRHTEDGKSPETWYFRRHNKMTIGVGPALEAHEPTLSTPRQRKTIQRKWEDFAIRRLMKFSTFEMKFGN